MRHAHSNWFEKLVRARRVTKPRLPESPHAYDSSALKPERALTTSDNGTSIFGSVAHKGGQLGQLAAKWGSDSEWPMEHCATEPERFVHRFLPTAARLARPGCVALILLLTILSASSAVREVQCRLARVIHDAAVEASRTSHRQGIIGPDNPHPEPIVQMTNDKIRPQCFHLRSRASLVLL